MGRRGLVVVLSVVAALILSSCSLTFTFPSTRGPSYPKAWDPRVLPVVSFVEQHRGLTFKHPIYVDFLSEADFKKQVLGGGNLSADDKKELERQQGIFRALGVVSGDFDLAKETKQLAGSGIVGLYSFQDKRVRVRGNELTDQVKVTLAHELTHALQDQRLDAGVTAERVGKDKNDDEMAFRSVLEGDAVRIEKAYRDSLPDDARKQLDAADAADQKKFEGDVAAVPPFLKVLFGAPYELGAEVVGRAVDKMGNSGVDALFEHAPTQVIQVMDPWLAGSAWDTAKAPVPQLNSGEKKRDQNKFGAFGLYLVLSERLPYGRAMQAADLWADDIEIDYTKGSTSCLRAQFVGKDRSDTEVITAALTDWAAGSGGAATVEDKRDSVVLSACDPGAAAKAGADHAEDAAYVLSVRNGIEVDIEKEGANRSDATCFSNAVVNGFSTDDLHRLDTSKPTAADQQKFREFATNCHNQT